MEDEAVAFAWRTSPPFDGPAAELPAGAAMDDHPLFPVVWPARSP